MQAPIQPLTNILTWHECTLRNFQLRHESRVLAMLYWPHPVGTSAVGETASHHYAFKQTSRFGPHVRISDAKTGKYIATLGKVNLNELEHVTFISGQTFVFKPLLEGSFLIEDLQGVEVMSLCNSDTRANRQITCVVCPTAAQFSEDILLLAMLGLYLLELQYEDDLAASVASTVLL